MLCSYFKTYLEILSKYLNDGRRHTQHNIYIKLKIFSEFSLTANFFEHFEFSNSHEFVMFNCGWFQRIIGQFCGDVTNDSYKMVQQFVN